ncbi:MAG: amino acid permease [Bacteroidota bacterium]
MDKKLSLYAALSVVVANMIGTGVFTSLGFQVADIKSGFVLMMLWIVGGVIALCGALSYAELGAALPRSGGEYNFLGQLMHPSLGFVSGWVSATIGFAAPTALAAFTFGSYLNQIFPSLSPTWLAAGLIIVVTLIHSSSLRNSSWFQSGFTSLKVLLILAFIGVGFLLVETPQPIQIVPAPGDWSLLTGSAFAVSLIYVSYAYTGWNAATYLINEMETPKRNLPLVLGIGTGLVMILYVLLNYIFLYAAPISALEGKLEVGYVAAQYMFGSVGANIMGSVLALLLISTVSAMMLAGPRVLQVIGQDFSLFSWLNRTNQHGVPTSAVFFQSGIALFFVFSSSFDSVLLFAGFTLGVSTLLTVAGIFVLRTKFRHLPRPYEAWGYPVTPIIYLVLMGWTLLFILQSETQEALAGLGIIAFGFLAYWGSTWWEKRK